MAQARSKTILLRGQQTDLPGRVGVLEEELHVEPVMPVALGDGEARAPLFES